MAKRKRTVYRDSLTGRLVSKATWKRSKAHGGRRYVRQVLSTGRKRRRAPTPLAAVLPATLSGVKTFFVTLKYTNSRGSRVFDFFVRARREKDIDKFIARFAANEKRLAFDDADPRSRSVIEYLESFGWTERRVAEIPKGEFPEYDDKPEGFVAYQ